MKVLELFAGSQSFSNIARKKFKMSTFTIDNIPFEGINLVKDIEFLKMSDIPFIPDIIWASPPCTTYSIVGIRFHRKHRKAISEAALKSDRLLEHTLILIKQFLKINPQIKFFIENPVGMMRKLIIMKSFNRATITYCSYGDKRMKPTDIFTNHLDSPPFYKGWIPRKQCFKGNINCHHEKAPRGSKTGTQGLKNNYERSKIPNQLSFEILKSCI